MPLYRAGFKPSMTDTRSWHPKPVVSVVVPMLDAADTIGPLLDSLAAQSYADTWEVVLADNGSADASVEIARRWADRLPGFRIVSCGERRGGAYALNAGTRAASGALVAYCNDDDVVSPEWLAAIVGALGDHELATGPIDLALLNAPDTYRWRGCAGWDRLPDWHRFLPAALGCNLAVRQTLFDRLGGFDVRMKHCADFEFEWRAQLGGATLGFAPEAVVHWRSRSSALAYFRAHVGYGMADVRLFVQFKSHGMPRRTGAGLIRAALLVPCCPLLLLRSQRYRWLAGAGIAVGHVLGSCRTGVLYP